MAILLVDTCVVSLIVFYVGVPWPRSHKDVITSAT